MILSSTSVIFRTYVTMLSLNFTLRILNKISKIIKGLAFPMCGSSYTVGPHTYIPIFFESIGVNFSFLFPNELVKNISLPMFLGIY